MAYEDIYLRRECHDHTISGCHKDGSDRLYGERLPTEIDEDIREEYWTEIRGMPEKKAQKLA